MPAVSVVVVLERPRKVETTMCLTAKPTVEWTASTALLLREAGLGARAEFLADVVMLPLAATAYAYFRGTRR